MRDFVSDRVVGAFLILESFRGVGVLERLPMVLFCFVFLFGMHISLLYYGLQ